MKKYNIIYADPPWKYKDSANAGKRGAKHHYNVMSMDEIKSLNVGAIAADNCALFLWVTFPFLQEGFDLIKAWGFKYKTCAFTWVKTNKKAGTFFMGMGNWTRSNPELCLLGIKGKPKRVNSSVRNLIVAPMIGHSVKPKNTKTRIVKLMGDLPRVELFAREKTLGWDVWGDEVDPDLMLMYEVDNTKMTFSSPHLILK